MGGREASRSFVLRGSDWGIQTGSSTTRRGRSEVGLETNRCIGAGASIGRGHTGRQPTEEGAKEDGKVAVPCSREDAIGAATRGTGSPQSIVERNPGP